MSGMMMTSNSPQGSCREEVLRLAVECQGDQEKGGNSAAGLSSEVVGSGSAVTGPSIVYDPDVTEGWRTSPKREQVNWSELGSQAYQSIDDVQALNDSLQPSLSSKPKTNKNNGIMSICPRCNREYNHRSSLYRHLKYECGKEPQFHCPFCPHRTKLKKNLQTHVKMLHRNRNRNRF